MLRFIKGVGVVLLYRVGKWPIIAGMSEIDADRLAMLQWERLIASLLIHFRILGVTAIFGLGQQERDSVLIR